MVATCRKLIQMIYDTVDRLEPLAYTPGAYRRAGPASFLGEVKRTGTIVYKAS